MTKQPTIYEKRRRKLTLNVLQDLYNLRALTTEQLSSRFKYSTEHMRRTIRRLRAKQLIVTEKVRGYKRKKRHQGDYHRISTKGIRYLNQADFPTSRTADQLRVNEHYLGYVLSVSDLVINLESKGWQVVSGRDVKEMFGLNRADNIHGMLISPDGTKYGIYIFLDKVTDYNMKKIKGEINRYTSFPNMLFLTKNQASFNQVKDTFSGSNDIVKFITFGVLPFTFGINYLITLNTEEKLMNFLQDYDVTPHPQADLSEAPIGLEKVVIHEDEEKYFVNMLDNNLSMLSTIRNYRKERYELDGRKVLVATHMVEIISESLEDIHHVDCLEVTHAEMADYFRSY